MRITVNSKQLNQINNDLGLNLKSGDYISYNKFINNYSVYKKASDFSSEAFSKVRK